jgi:signal peptidase
MEQDQLKEYAKGIATVIIIVVAFLIIFKVAFGFWVPMHVVSSGSMEPNIKVGDIIFVQNISRTTVITQQDAVTASRPHITFKEPGDVILYRPYGSKGNVPIVHRAMYYVEAGEEMWPGGPKAPHAGYITKGDNNATNTLPDQQTGIMPNTPIKEEWIVGVVKFKIPYVGHIRLTFEKLLR